MSFQENFGKGLVNSILPRRAQPRVRFYLERAGIYKTPYSAVAYLFYLSLVITGVILYFIWPQLSSFAISLGGRAGLGLFVFIGWFVIQIVVVGFIAAFIYFLLDLAVFRRAVEIEEKLADYLSVVSTNLKGGMSFDAAISNAVRPEFGILGQEMTVVSKKILTGHDPDAALSEFSAKYDSPELKRTISLIISESEVGGKVSKIIDDLVTNLRETRKLKNQMVASVVSYVIFISAIVLFIAPTLFALSYNLLSFIEQFIGRLAGSVQSQNVPGFLASIGNSSIDSDMFKSFGYIAVGTIAFISSMIVSIIQKGDIKSGVKYIPIFTLIALVVYHFALLLLGILLGGIAI